MLAAGRACISDGTCFNPNPGLRPAFDVVGNGHGRMGDTRSLHPQDHSLELSLQPIVYLKGLPSIQSCAREANCTTTLYKASAVGTGKLPLGTTSPPHSTHLAPHTSHLKMTMAWLAQSFVASSKVTLSGREPVQLFVKCSLIL